MGDGANGAEGRMAASRVVQMSRIDSPLRDRVIFVVGARRSGTTWLQRILTAHPDVVPVPSETYLFSHGIAPFLERFQHANPSSQMIGSTFIARDTLLDAMRSLVDQVLLGVLDRTKPDARYVVERTPSHASHIPLIAEVYPDARVINIVRDARAVARSLVAMPWGPDSIEDAAVEWRDAVVDAQTAGKALGDRYHEVIYEELLRDPRRGTNEIFTWLGLSLPDETWERILMEAGAEFNADPASPGIRADKWRDELSRAELRSVERVAGAELEALGYPLAAADSRGGAARGPIRRALSRAAATVRRPRKAVRAARKRSLARRMHEQQLMSHGVVEAFERSVANGDDSAARALLAPRVRVRIDEGAGQRESRGPAAADELVDLLGDHRRRRMHLLSGRVHASPLSVTTIATYSLGDGGVWARTLMYKVHGGRLTEVGLYRYACATGTVSPPPSLTRTAPPVPS